jgi:hypothetical protein
MTRKSYSLAPTDQVLSAANLDSMVCARRLSRIAALFLCLVLLPSLAVAQESALRVPTIAASAAAAADWASTYYAVKYFHVRELNPFINQMQHEPARMISMGAAIDAGIVSAWNLGMGRKNERVAIAGLWTMAAFRTYLAIHNLRNTRKAERRIIREGLEDRASLDVSMNCAGPVTAPTCGAADRTVR